MHCSALSVARGKMAVGASVLLCLVSARPALADDQRTPAAVEETQPHSIFGIKRHVGVAVGYDNDVIHGSLGFYVTVAEWGRWNFGGPSPALGFGRYAEYDNRTKHVFEKDQVALFISLASVHYRMGYVRSLGMNWYINLEQIFDTRQNALGSQVGITLSTK
jgi:hypothetical protein